MACAVTVVPNSAETISFSSHRHKNQLTRFLSHAFPVVTILFCTFVMIVGGTLTKLLTSLPPWQITTIRNAAQTPVAFVIYFCVHFKQHYDRQHPFSLAILRRSGAKLIARGTCGVVASICFVYAVQNLPFGDANAIILSSPVFVALWAYFVLPNERLSFVIIFGLLLTVVGVLLVSQPEVLFGSGRRQTSANDTNFVLGVCTAIGCAVVCSFNAILSRTLRYEKATLLLIYYSVIGLVVNAIITTITGTWTRMDSLQTWLLMGGICLTGCISQYLVLYSFQLGNANVVSIMFTLEIVWGYVAVSNLFVVMNFCLLIIRPRRVFPPYAASGRVR